MSMKRVSKLTESDINRVFYSGDRKVVILDTFKSLYIGRDIDTNEEFSFYNTGEPTGLGCGWLERGSK